MKAFEEKLRKSLTLEVPYYARPLPNEGTPAAVLALFGFPRAGGEPSLLLTKRTDSVEKHKGQIAFPGGMTDPDDDTPEATALRETEEEVGLPRSMVRVVGVMPKFWVRTGFMVTPVVGILTPPMEEIEFVASPGEIAEVFWTPLQALRDPSIYSAEIVTFGGAEYAIHSYQYRSHRVWGATGSMIKNLLDRLDSLG